MIPKRKVLKTGIFVDIYGMVYLFSISFVRRLRSLTAPLLITAVCFSLFSCDSQSGKPAPVLRDTTITQVNAFNNLFMDSLLLEKSIAADSSRAIFGDKFRRFYAGRNYQFAWFDTSGLVEQAINFKNLFSSRGFELQDSALLAPELSVVIDSLQLISGKQSPENASALRNKLLETELALTRHFFFFAQKTLSGNQQLDMTELEWFIPRKKIQADDLLDSMLRNKGKAMEDLAPISKQYKLLLNYLNQYYQIQKAGEWLPIEADQKKYSPGDSSSTITAIKYKLRLLGDYTDEDSTGFFNEALTEAVKKYQFRHGITEDGVVGPQFLKRINANIDQRIRQILINLERMRWVPREPDGDYLLVNIPEYRLHVYENGELSFDIDVVVGKAQHSTVIFTDNLKYVVFSPYWNVPPGILTNEILPAVQKNLGYLDRQNMEVVKGKEVISPSSINWKAYTGKNFPYMIRQKPGENNSLGRVKFLFPNNYNIYFHDTPAKSLFGESRRDFSHGCIRLSEPAKLAEHLLRNDSTYTAEKIKELMMAGQEKYVTLKKPVPVFIGYFTAWVDKNGLLNFRDDVYGHDAKLSAKLFATAATAANTTDSTSIK